jgi:hypothetical protein
MKLFLCTFKLDYTPYMGRTRKGEKDFRLVWANDEDEAQVKLERELAPPTEPGGDSYWLHEFEAHEAIQ